MTHIGLLSDTHNYLHPKVFDFFEKCDEIWHAGDIGNAGLASQLASFKKLRAVYGNIDGHDVRVEYPEIQLFHCEDVKVMMQHIGGYPGRYEPATRQMILREKPALFISGHSHILKVIYDKKHQLLHMNPGAAGKYGFHQVITLLRFNIESRVIKDLEIMELQKHAEARL